MKVTVRYSLILTNLQRRFPTFTNLAPQPTSSNYTLNIIISNKQLFVCWLLKIKIHLISFTLFHLSVFNTVHNLFTRCIYFITVSSSHSTPAPTPGQQRPSSVH